MFHPTSARQEAGMANPIAAGVPARTLQLGRRRPCLSSPPVPRQTFGNIVGPLTTRTRGRRSTPTLLPCTVQSAHWHRRQPSRPATRLNTPTRISISSASRGLHKLGQRGPLPAAPCCPLRLRQPPSRKRKEKKNLVECTAEAPVTNSKTSSPSYREPVGRAVVNRGSPSLSNPYRQSRGMMGCRGEAVGGV